MSHLGRGCLRYRQGRVKCDQGRPACHRCVNRNKVCEGYRDEASMVFRQETQKVVEHANPMTMSPVTTTSRNDAINRFIDKYVLYSCNETSSPGFVEHIPSLFNDVNMEGRFALRWAVRAAAFADLLKAENSDVLEAKAFHCCGLSLSVLGESLKAMGKIPDDYDLMTAVMLDIFETFFIDDPSMRGAHAQGTLILSLRGSDQIYSPRGWSLFRLAHHRILNDDVPFIRLKKDSLCIGKTCERASVLQDTLSGGSSSISEVLDMVHELMKLYSEVASWRKKPEWSYKVLNVSDLPSTIQLHPDLWISYEWNYHRAARIIAYQQVLECLEAAMDSLTPDDVANETLHILTESLQEQYAPSTVSGNRGYLLLWPIKIIKGEQFATTPEQKHKGQIVFERIRQYTGMKSQLGSLSLICLEC
ncbi:hypothetical protein F4814DRAFT_461067 [Daldinia grandis]|nr:hypothetical protein F4814DRAFT_461067 [Daldinia grandis]